ncbi:Toxin 1, PIN domain [hydrothermal vent metagenome]|uniref:Toxin 1, PIN domain n=1 Tax=hydrothermal vent metagenome TaxID=652676 RepID=A0A3B1E0E1_9ZZZZ
MIIVDTSIWISHLRKKNILLTKELLTTNILIHPFIIGELACGNLKNRKEFISLLQTLPQTQTVTQEEILYFIEHHQLMGLGIGFIDIHLLASTQLTKSLLWTADKKLHAIAKKFNLIYSKI